MTTCQNTVIESLGVYLPPLSISTEEVLEGCKNQIRFPLEKVSGIRFRRMAGQEEYSIDLAKQATAQCFANSKYNPNDIDLLICCNISRIDGPDICSFEPSTAIKLRKHFKMSNALVFDITNACAGMFTGVYLVNALLMSGAIRRGMVVSGEYITHLTKTAQREIENFMDMRLACLTLGDSGAAVILEKGKDTLTGFQEIELQTFGRYSPFCIAKVSDQGGWIMHTDSLNLTEVGIKSGAENALDLVHKAGWAPDNFQHVILHQTSRMTLKNARNEINSLFKSQILQDSNTIDNLEERGNTASTSHFVAIDDQIRNNRIQSGDKVVFGISASGLTAGSALYIFDDLPDRLRQKKSGKDFFTKNEKASIIQTKPFTRGVRIESIGTVPLAGLQSKDSMDLLCQAASDCLEKSSHPTRDIGLLIHCGVYRTGYLLEPAYASLLAGKLNMNAAYSDPENKKTLAFDIFNGSMGFLNSCYTAQQMVASGKYETAMIVAAETENNAMAFPGKLLGIRETASAIILDAHPIQGKGFTSFLFKYDTESIDTYSSYCSTREVEPYLNIVKAPDLEENYLELIDTLIEEMLLKEGLSLNQIDVIFPPQLSSEFIRQLAGRHGLSQEKLINVVGEGPDLFSSSIPYALEHALEKNLVKPGDIGLMISVGSGVQAGCAIYQF